MRENCYHITVGTYGTRLHGGTAPTVDRRENHYGDPFVKADRKLYDFRKSKLSESPCYLTKDQRTCIEETIPELCERGKWNYHIAACQPDHFHCLISSPVDPKDIRRWLKTWLTQRLNETFEARKWFARDGSTKWIFDEKYFHNVFEYILRQRATPFSSE